MAIINRISRLFKADFHAVLDQVEEPHILLRQAIRDMEDDLGETELQLRHTEIKRDDLHLRREELEQARNEIDDQLDVCFESEEDELARDLIKRKLETQRLWARVSTRLNAADKNIQSLKTCLDENRAALESMRQKADLFTERSRHNSRPSAEFEDVGWNPRELNVSKADVEVAFLSEKKRRVGT